MSIEIPVTSTNDVDGVLERLDAKQQSQLTRDFICAMLIVDSMQHNEYAPVSEMKLKDLIGLIPLLTGENDAQTESDGNVHKLWLSELSYLQLTVESECIAAIALVLPQIENGFGNAFVLDFDLP